MSARRAHEKLKLPPLAYDTFVSDSLLNDFVEALAASQPTLCRLGSLGMSREGRPIHLLTITDFESGEPEDRPAFLVLAGIHAVELAGTYAALYTARQLLIDHTESDPLKHMAFYVIPRLNPDGSEFARLTSTRVRSRTDFENKATNTVYPEDINGDGLILTIRREHPDGEFVADPLEPRLLIKRRADSQGPFYGVLPEGFIHEWDGGDPIRAAGLHAWLGNDPEKSGGRSFDWNRNFPHGWRPETDQQGAGDHPLSEPEARYLADFMRGRPNLTGMLDYHTGTACILRPPAGGPRTDIPEPDNRMLDELGHMGCEETGFPLLTPVECHPAYLPDKFRGGHLLDYVYYDLGLFAFTVELGTAINGAGVSTEEILAAGSADETDGHNRRLMRWWDDQDPRPPLFRPWEPFDHPQLGRVEIGGFLYTCLDNPSPAGLAATVPAAYRFTLRLARRRAISCSRLQEKQEGPIDGREDR